MRSRSFYGAGVCVYVCVCVLMVQRRVLWCRIAVAVFVMFVSGQVLGGPRYKRPRVCLRHPTCFYGTGPRVSASNFCVSSYHSCSQTRRDSSESNFREPKELAHDNEMIRPQQTRDENASSFLSTKPIPHTPNFPSRGEKNTQKCPTHECEANLLFLFLSERYHSAKQCF